MRGDVPLVETHFPLFLLAPSSRTASIPINTSLLGSEPIGFVYNEAEVTKVNNWNNTRGCGSYDMNTNS
eukprot:10383638-Ditylum_brightwellii.AAC.1